MALRWRHGAAYSLRMSVEPPSDIAKRKGPIRDLAARLSPRHAALVIIDIQNDFCASEGVFGGQGYDVSRMPAMAENNRRLLEAARRAGVLIVFVRACYDEVALGKPLAEQFHKREFTDSMCLSGSWGIEWYGGIEPGEAANEVVVTKHHFSAFWDTDLDLYLRGNGIETVVCTGVVTSGCVESTARDAFFRDYAVVVAEDCVADPQADRHRASLSKLAQTFGSVVSSGEVARIWAGEATNLPAAWSEAGKRALLAESEASPLSPPHTALLSLGLAEGTREAAALGRLDGAARRAGLLRIDAVTECPPAARSAVSIRAAASDGPNGAPLSEGAVRIVKHRASAFADTSLGHLLRANDIRALVVAGSEMHVDVDATARDGHMRDYHVVVAADCVAPAAAGEGHLHAASLETLARHFGRVMTSKAILSRWSG